MRGITRKYRNIAILALFQVVHLILAAAQFPQLHFENITTDDGLSNNVVTCLYQDKKGFLWIGTTNGLNRYDGNLFQTFYFDEQNRNSISGSSIVDIIEDENGILWIATRDGGISKYDPSLPAGKQFTQIRHNPDDPFSLTSDRMNSIFNLNKDYLIISAEGMSLGFLNKKSFEITYPANLNDSIPDDFLNPAKAVKKPISSNWVHRMYADEKYIYLSFLTGGGKVYIYDKFTYELKTTSFNIFTATIQYFTVDDNTIWYGSWAKGLYAQENYSPGIRLPLQHRNVLSFPDEVTDIDSWNDRILFASTRNSGIYMVDKKTFDFVQLTHNRSDRHSIASNRVICMLKDKNGIWWIGTNNGLSKYNPVEWQFTATEISNDYSTDIVHYSIFEENNTLRLCTNNGIYKKSPGDENFQLIQIEYDETVLEPTQIYQVENGRYILNTENSSYWYDPNSETVEIIQIDSFYSFKMKIYYKYNPPLRGNYQVRDMFTDTIEGKTVYVFATLGWGMGIYELERSIFYDFVKLDNKSIGNNMIRVLFRDSKNDYWVGTSEGLYRWKKSFPFKNEFNRYKNIAGDTTTISHNSIAGIYEDRNGIIWVATNSGLNAFDGNTFTRFYPPFNSSHFMYEIYADKNEQLWIAVDDGFESFDPVSREFRHVRIPNHEWAFKSPAKIYKLADGTWIYGAGNNLVNFKPAEFDFETEFPEPYLTNFSVFQDNMTQTASATELSLRYKQNVIAIAFSCLQLSQPKTVKYQYCLKGLNDVWTDLGSNGSVTFTGLPPGSYRLSVRVTNAQGSWSGEKDLVSFTIARPFWLQAWFFVLCLLSASGVVFVVVKYREKQIKNLQHIRNKIASDLHDDIGSALSTINLYSEVAKMKTGNGEITHILNKISDTSIEMQENMTQIVWSLEPRNDQFEFMILRLKRYATETLQAKNITTEFIYDDNVRNLKIDAEKRRELFLIYKEAVNNIIKYAECTCVTFNFTMQKKNFEMQIDDNGIGFEVGEQTSGNGLFTMKQRAEKLKGVLKIRSIPREGTQLHLAFPLG